MEQDQEDQELVVTSVQEPLVRTKPRERWVRGDAMWASRGSARVLGHTFDRWPSGSDATVCNGCGAEARAWLDDEQWHASWPGDPCETPGEDHAETPRKATKDGEDPMGVWCRRRVMDTSMSDGGTKWSEDRYRLVPGASLGDDTVKVVPDWPILGNGSPPATGFPREDVRPRGGEYPRDPHRGRARRSSGKTEKTSDSAETVRGGTV